MVFTISNIISKFKDSTFIVSGGYKAMIAYANLAAILFNKTAYYKYENANTSIAMPILPIGLDFTLYSLFRNNILNVLNCANNKTIAAELKIIPELFAKHLIMYDDRSNRYVFTPLGILLETAYKAKKAKVYGTLPQEYYKADLPYDEISTDNIICSDLKNKIDVLLKLNYVIKIKFEDKKEIPVNPVKKEEKDVKDICAKHTAHHFLAYLSAARGKVKYVLYSKNSKSRCYQIVTVTTISSTESMVRTIFGDATYLNVN